MRLWLTLSNPRTLSIRSVQACTPPPCLSRSHHTSRCVRCGKMRTTCSTCSALTGRRRRLLSAEEGADEENQDEEREDAEEDVWGLKKK